MILKFFLRYISSLLILIFILFFGISNFVFADSVNGGGFYANESINLIENTDLLHADYLRNKLSISEISNESKVCKMYLEYTLWSSCEDGLQTREVLDINWCNDIVTQSRKCTLNNTDLENSYLSSKVINLIDINNQKRYFSSDFDDNSYLGFFTTNNPYFYINESFIIVNKNSNKYYLARPIGLENGVDYYSLKYIDDGMLSELEFEGLIPTLISDDLSDVWTDILRSSSFPFVLGFFSLFLLLIIMMVIIFHFKKTHQKKGYFDVYTSKKDDVSSLENNYTSNEIDKYKSSIDEVKEYVKRNKNIKSSDEIRSDLKSAGWMDDVIDVVLNTTDNDVNNDNVFEDKNNN